MASLQQKGESWYCQFMYRRRRHTLTLGKVHENEAKATAARIDYLLMRVRQRLLEVPHGVDIVTFLEFDGKPPVVEPNQEQPKLISFADFRESYLQTLSNGALEDNTIYTIQIHFRNLARTLGERFLVKDLELKNLQEHVNRRAKNVSAVTIKKEIDTFRAAWKWGCRMKLTQGSFPNEGLVYPKTDEKLPFMTMEEIQRRIKAGASPQHLWGCLYLKQEEIEELLDHVRDADVRPWVYPAFVFVAHTGARRSEMIRARAEDIDFATGTITLRERKRKKGQRSSRRVPMSTRLKEVLTEWLNRHHTEVLFSSDARSLTSGEAIGGFAAGVRRSRWEKMRGWHVLRHSFISALASQGVDQRIIDDFVGHQTDEQRRRYRHLYPSTQNAAIKAVFG
jgi:integrase